MSKIEIVLEEAAAALSFHERCLFYAKARNPRAHPQRQGLSRYYDLRDYLEDIKNHDDLLEDPGTKEATTELLAGYLARKVCDVYRNSIEILFSRLSPLLLAYLPARKEIEDLGVRLGDRDKLVTKETPGFLLERCTKLLKLTSHNINLSIKKKSSIRMPIAEWGLARSCGEIMMSEVSFLSKRIDDFHSVQNSHKSINFSKISVYIAVGALLVSTFFEILGYFKK